MKYRAIFTKNLEEIMAAWGKLPRYSLSQGNRWIVIDSGMDFFGANGVVLSGNGELGYELKAAAELVEKKRAFIGWVIKEDEAKRLEQAVGKSSILDIGTPPVMFRKTPTTPLETEHSGIKISKVASLEELKPWTQAMGEVFSWPPEATSIFEDILGSPEWSFFAAHLDGKLVGFVANYYGSEVVHLNSLGTLESYRNRGIGRALVNHCLNDARDRGYENVLLVSASTEAKLYRKTGFEEQFKITTLAVDPK